MTVEAGVATNQPAGGVGATNSPAGTGDTPEFETIQITEQTGFKLPKGTVIPDAIKQSITEKDKTLKDYSAIKLERDRLRSEKAELERKLSPGGLQLEPKPRADPYDNPDGYSQEVEERSRRAAREETKRISQMEKIRDAELTTLANLVNTHFKDEIDGAETEAAKEEIFNTRCKEVLDSIKQRNWGISYEGEDQMPYLNEGIVQQTFNAHFLPTLISRAEKKALDQLQEAVGGEAMGSGSIPASEGKKPTKYGNVKEFVDKDPEGAKEEANKRMTEELDRKSQQNR